MATKNDAATIESLSFEDALSELEGIVRQLESGEVGLDGAISAYSRGASLRDHCNEKLRQAQEKIEKIQPSANGGVTAVGAGMSEESTS